MYYISVIVIKNDVVDANYLFSGEHSRNVAEQAELKFYDLCSQYVSNWDEYTDEDKEIVVDEGYCGFVTGSVCISWPDLVEHMERDINGGPDSVASR